MIHKKDITGIILAGGKSSRMGTDKGFLLWKGRPFIQHSIIALKPVVSKLIVVSDHTHYDILSYKRVQDIYPDAGPLSGLYSGLKASETEFNLVLSCDVPLINSSVLEKLLTNYNNDIAAVVCSADDKIMPLVALYHKNCYHVCKSLLDKGERRMMRLLDHLPSINYVLLDENETESVKNINSPTDLKNIENAN
ncbi:molybdenum cofactor guanylyltransferase [Winogradskyella jejuensis]|uniref:Probable molybdenum cofactor guanylyltransferase n=1 Tax=Winogradskyella jejuensis TaxID=1089305 RepID=A0A1M5KSZ3_9FLAO|nr:molybdenum cofactor guanylyltransferase [Winogradskyella jejuensis]SHG55846.1 molybdenum cofactor guanylyltransferase [Winogradskyella jejuensis]